jgi:predicted nucleotidyltransferase
MISHYEITLNELKSSLLKEFGDKVKSIVVYGSVARGEADEESDLDVFIVLEDNSIYRRVSDIAYKIDLKNRTATSIFWATPEELMKYLKNGSPFIENVASEDFVLYDDGVFTRVRESIYKKS